MVTPIEGERENHYLVVPGGTAVTPPGRRQPTSPGSGPTRPHGALQSGPLRGGAANRCDMCDRSSHPARVRYSTSRRHTKCLRTTEQKAFVAISYPPRSVMSASRGCNRGLIFGLVCLRSSTFISIQI